jgi:hypothetical protein
MRLISIGLLSFCLCTTSLFAKDITTSTIKLKVVKKYIPENWVVEKISQTDAPVGWKTIRGGKGIKVKFANFKDTVHHPIIGDYHPTYSFTLMPLDWEGKSKLGDIFKGGKLSRSSNTISIEQIYPDKYEKKYHGIYVFDSYLSKGDWKIPFGDLQKYFEGIKIF